MGAGADAAFARVVDVCARAEGRATASSSPGAARVSAERVLFSDTVVKINRKDKCVEARAASYLRRHQRWRTCHFFFPLSSPVRARCVVAPRFARVRARREQKRSLVITELAVYNLSPDRSLTLKRRIPIDGLAGVSDSEVSDEFVLHVRAAAPPPPRAPPPAAFHLPPPPPPPPRAGARRVRLPAGDAAQGGGH